MAQKRNVKRSYIVTLTGKAASAIQFKALVVVEAADYEDAQIAAGRALNAVYPGALPAGSLWSASVRCELLRDFHVVDLSLTPMEATK